ncbi:hypothetical protein HPP92_027196 [Vanilla planifolia]|uniref:Uncharacterized protein n=1 Tax=Vanilla planifolia TaxID=51239 RepID=A0A835PFW8_VANPL|nr:hypothetical protein HPP92_027196 [Vanilla planifolia]
MAQSGSYNRGLVSCAAEYPNVDPWTRALPAALLPSPPPSPYTHLSAAKTTQLSLRSSSTTPQLLNYKPGANLSKPNQKREKRKKHRESSRAHLLPRLATTPPRA